MTAKKKTTKKDTGIDPTYAAMKPKPKPSSGNEGRLHPGLKLTSYFTRKLTKKERDDG